MIWPLTLAWAHVLYLPVTACLIGSVLGLLIGGRRGRRAEAAGWRREGDRPNSSHRVESGGRLYWVVGEDAPLERRTFVAHMLTADAPMLQVSMGVTCGSCRHTWRYSVTPELKTSSVACPSCGVENLTVRRAGGENVTVAVTSAAAPCPGCQRDLARSDATKCDDGNHVFECPCGTASEWDFDCIAPLLVASGKDVANGN